MNLCEYGCGQEAKYQFKNGRRCCSEHWTGCSYKRNEASEKNKGKEPWNKGKTYEELYGEERSKEIKEKISESHKGEKNYWYGKRLTSSHKQNIAKSRMGQIPGIETRKKLSLKSTGRKNAKKGKKYERSVYNTRRLTIDIISKKYPLFSKIEEMKYNPDKPEEYEIQIHCKYYECKNSKEYGGWFTPTYIQLYERIRQIEKNGLDHIYFYCSQECKDLCPLYNSRGNDPFKDIDSPYTRGEYETWIQEVKKLDNSECQICGAKDHIHVHHIIPKKLEPIFALDPTNGICLCEKCHYKYGHKDNKCKTVNLANKQCKKA